MPIVPVVHRGFSRSVKDREKFVVDVVEAPIVIRFADYASPETITCDETNLFCEDQSPEVVQ